MKVLFIIVCCVISQGLILGLLVQTIAQQLVKTVISQHLTIPVPVANLPASIASEQLQIAHLAFPLLNSSAINASPLVPKATPTQKAHAPSASLPAWNVWKDGPIDARCAMEMMESFCYTTIHAGVLVQQALVQTQKTMFVKFVRQLAVLFVTVKNDRNVLSVLSLSLCIKKYVIQFVQKGIQRKFQLVHAEYGIYLIQVLFISLFFAQDQFLLYLSLQAAIRKKLFLLKVKSIISHYKAQFRHYWLSWLHSNSQPV